MTHKTCSKCVNGFWRHGEKKTFICGKFWAGDEDEPAGYWVEVSEEVADAGCEDCRNWAAKPLSRRDERRVEVQRELF